MTACNCYIDEVSEVKLGEGSKGEIDLGVGFIWEREGSGWFLRNLVRQLRGGQWSCSRIGEEAWRIGGEEQP